MAASVITTKGQTTIPKEIRNYLNLHSGDKVEFTIGTDGKVIVTPAAVDLRSLKGFLKRPNQGPVSVEKMNETIKKGAAHR